MNTNTIKYILSVVQTARLVGIDNVIIEPTCVRAMSDANDVIILEHDNVLGNDTGIIGLTRLSTLLARYNIVQAMDQMTVTANNPSNDQYVKSLIFKAKGITIDYRCGNPTTIKAPKQINDIMGYQFRIGANVVDTLRRGHVAMSATVLSIIYKDNMLYFEMTDANNDVFSYQHDTQIGQLAANAPQTFVHKYPIKVLLALLKEDPNAHISIGMKGMLKFPINQLTLYILPQV